MFCTPLVWPEITASTPCVDGPKVSVQALSLMAKCWA